MRREPRLSGISPSGASSSLPRLVVRESVRLCVALAACEVFFHIAALWIYRHDPSIHREFRFVITLNAWLRVPIYFFGIYVTWLAARLLLRRRGWPSVVWDIIVFGTLGAFLGWLSTEISL